jgi:general secretion pathway protein L
MAKIKERSVRRVLVFVPPARAQAGRAALSPASVVRFAALPAAGPAETGESPIALLPKAAQVDLVFDPGDVFTGAIEAPKLSDARLRQALPNLLEDRLLSDPGDCQFAFTPPAASGDTTVAAAPKLPVAVIDRGVLTRARDALHGGGGQRARAAYSELYTVPAPDAGVLAVRADLGHGVARTGRHDGFTFDLGPVEPGAGPGDPPPALSLAVRQLGIRRLVVYGGDAPRLVALGRALAVEVVDAGRPLDFDATAGAVNLLQGAFAPTGLFAGLLANFGGGVLRPAALKWPAIWAAAAIAVYVIGMNAFWLKLEGEGRAIRTQMESAFRSAFPEATAVVDPVLQTRRQLGGLRARAGQPSADDFSVLNAQAAQLMAGAPLGSVTGVEYRDGVLSVKFKPGTGQDAALQNALRTQAIQQGLGVRFDADGTARLAPAGQ